MCLVNVFSHSGLSSLSLEKYFFLKWDANKVRTLKRTDKFLISFSFFSSKYALPPPSPTLHPSARALLHWLGLAVWCWIEWREWTSLLLFLIFTVDWWECGFLLSVSKMNCIDWFSNVDLASHFRDKPHLVIQNYSCFYIYWCDLLVSCGEFLYMFSWGMLVCSFLVLSFPVLVSG